MEKNEKMNLEGLQVLVVDDNLFNQRLISHILHQWRVSADVATDGKTAVEMVAREPYDVVLMDPWMPEMDGYETTRAIRAMEGSYYRNLPIFIFSEADIIPGRMAECGISGFISESVFHSDDLYHTISPFLKQA